MLKVLTHLLNVLISVFLSYLLAGEIYDFVKLLLRSFFVIEQISDKFFF